MSASVRDPAIDRLAIDDLSVIAADTVLTGRIDVSRTLRLEGRVHGEIVGDAAGSRVIVAESGLVQGEIRAGAVVIDGFVEGSVTATGSIRVSPRGRVVGKLAAPRVTLESGSFFEGQLETT